MIPKRGMLEILAKILDEALELLNSVDDHALFVLGYPYTGIDWRGCPDIFFIADEPRDDRVNIIVFFKLI